MLEMNYYVIEKELLNLNEVAVRDLLITGPKGSIHIDTKNITMIPDTYEAVENNNLGLELDVLFEIEVKQLDDYFYELIINNKKMEECKMMNHETVKQLIKMGELKAILKNVDSEGRIHNNCIALAKNDCVLLRTNGAVIYGLYDTTKQGNFGHKSKNLIPFTHDMLKPEPFVNTADYRTMKPIVLKAYRDIFDDNAKQKLEAVRYIISNHKWYREQLAKVDKPQETKEVKTEIKKEEVKEMNKELNVMGLAHKIRRELGLEGHYSVQMKIAMGYAWAIKKGNLSLEELLNNTESTEATAPTYNVANTTVEQEAAVTKTTSEYDYLLKVHETETEGVFRLGVTEVATGVTKYYPNTISTLNMAAAYLAVGKSIEGIVKGLPMNTRIIAMPMTITSCKVRAGLKEMCKAKNITFEPFKANNILQDIVDNAPSGEAV